MTVGLAAAAVNGWLDGTFATASCFVKLHTADPGAAGATAAAAGDTSRKNPTMAAASGGSKAMTGTAGPWTNVSTTETISHISLWTASTAGTFNGSGALTASQAWVNTNTFTLTSLSVAITPIAA
jgi:hypothetical protein